jgi:probable phosphoglycerate mutase
LEEESEIVSVISRFMEGETGKETKMLNTRILLVRHGETDWNRTRRFQGRMDIPLNQQGRWQAQTLASALRDEPLTAIYSSPLERAKETASLIKAFHPLTPLYEEEGLIEMDLGEFDGIEAGEWRSQYPDLLEAWRSAPASLRMPGGEGLQEVQVRAINTMERITSLHSPGSLLVLGSHNFVIRSILCFVLGASLDRFRDYQQDPAALNVLCRKEGQWVAEVVNDVSHLKRYETESART